MNHISTPLAQLLEQLRDGHHCEWMFCPRCAPLTAQEAEEWQTIPPQCPDCGEPKNRPGFTKRCKPWHNQPRKEQK